MSKSSTTTMLESALEYAGAGLKVLPLHGIRKDGTCTCGRKDCHSPGKHPRTRNGLDDATTDEKQIKKWWGKGHWPNASIAGVGGDYMCIDVDIKSNGPASLKQLISDNSPLPITAVAQTGQYTIKGTPMRGAHYWFRVPEGVEIASKVGVREGIDIRCARGYAVLPPSAHVSGVDYEWMTEFEEVAEAPDWLVELLPEAVAGGDSWKPPKNYPGMSKEVRAFIEGRNEVDPGEQRAFLTRAARSVLATGQTVDEVAQLLWEGENDRGGICACTWSRDPWTFEEVLYIVEDVFRKAPPTSWTEDEKTGEDDEFLWDDMGNADRLVSLFDAGHLFYVRDWGKWYVWDVDNNRWCESTGDLVANRWQSYTGAAFQEAFQSNDQQFVKWLKRCRSRAMTDNAMWFAKINVGKKPGDLNKDPFLLNVQNGVLDLRTGDLLDSDPKLLLTKQARAEYNPKAKSALWNKFIKTLIPDPELRSFVQKVFGYTLTGSIEEQKFFYFHGPPASGKTTLLEVFSHLLGNYSESSDASTFVQKEQQSGPSEDIARLANARMVVTHEVEENSRWAVAKIARLTGGDEIPARFLHQNTFTFYPKFKLFFSANHKPKIGSARSGIWRRLIIVPIDRVIPESERDPMILNKLQQPKHMSAVLSWALEGCLMWMRDYEKGNFLLVPDVVKDEVDTYKQEESQAMQFASLFLVRTTSDKDRIPRRELYKIYQGWCDSEGRKFPLTANKLTRELQDLGYTAKESWFDEKTQSCWNYVKVKGLPTVKGKTKK